MTYTLLKTGGIAWKCTHLENEDCHTRRDWIHHGELWKQYFISLMWAHHFETTTITSKSTFALLNMCHICSTTRASSSFSVENLCCDPTMSRLQSLWNEIWPVGSTLYLADKFCTTKDTIKNSAMWKWGTKLPSPPNCPNLCQMNPQYCAMSMMRMQECWTKLFLISWQANNPAYIPCACAHLGGSAFKTKDSAFMLNHLCITTSADATSLATSIRGTQHH